MGGQARAETARLGQDMREALRKSEEVCRSCCCLPCLFSLLRRR
jgi:hypothetical protein